MKSFRDRLGAALRAIRLGRLALLLLGAFAAGLIADWVRADRVFFPRRPAPLTIVPSGQ